LAVGTCHKYLRLIVQVDNAINLLNEIRPKMSDKQREIYLARMATDGLAKGLTGVHNARASLEDVAFFKRSVLLPSPSRKWPPNLLPACRIVLLTCRRMAGENRLPTMIHCGDPPTFCGDKVEQVQDAGDGRLTVRAVKLFGDGALGSRGAALLEDYSDQPGWKGLLLEEEDKWEPLIRQWYEAVSETTVL
jgi:predicted amidohydrolase YtcJ